MADKELKVPKPPDKEEEEEEDFRLPGEEEEDAPKKPAMSSWIRIGIVAFVLFVLLAVGITMCGKRRTVQPTPGMIDSTMVQTPSTAPAPVAQPQQQQQLPQQLPVTQPTQGQTEFQVPAGSSVLVFNYIIRSGEVQNGESTIALVTNGQISSIQLNGEFYEVDNPQITRQGNKIVALSWGNTVYCLNENIAETLGIQPRSPYNNSGKGGNNGRRVQDTYIVRSGDYADDIRDRFGMKPGELKRLNKYYDLNFLKVGQKLTITRPE